MTLTECQEELLGHLAAMPFLDRLELVAVSGWSRGSVYESVEKFEAEGLAASVPHATDVTPPTRRFYLTPSGLHRLAGDEGMTVDELLRLYPVSARWQRVLLERLDAAAVIYRLAATISNIAHPKPESRRYEQASLDRLLNRINTSVASTNRHAFLIFDEGKEEMIARLYGRLKVRNHVPSRYDLWEDGEKTRNIPIEQVIGGPAFRSSKDDCLLQMADFVAHALLKQEEPPVPRVEDHGINGAFSILDKALNRQAARRDAQGVVRR